MHLAASSRKRELFAIVVVLALGIVASLLASGASARPAAHSTAIVPNGTYGVDKAASGEYIVFKVRNRRVRDLEFQIQVECKASDSPTIEPRFFSAGLQAPQGHVIPANGKLTLSWSERGEGRLGEIQTVLRFGARDAARIVVIVPEEDGPEAAPEEAKESCQGGSTLNFRRGYELPPMPVAP